MFIGTTNCPPVGMRVEIRLDIPAFDLVRRQWLRCTGRVTRVESRSRVRGFAVAGRIETDHSTSDREGAHDAREEEEEVATGTSTLGK
jgi:hypothetical protein